jgi:hypothetical protein
VGRLAAGKIRIVVVVRVVQADAVTESHSLAKVMRCYGVSMVVLRVIEESMTSCSRSIVTSF